MQLPASGPADFSSQSPDKLNWRSRHSLHTAVGCLSEACSKSCHPEHIQRLFLRNGHAEVVRMLVRPEHQQVA